MIIDFHTHTFPDNIASSVITKLSVASGTVAFTDGTETGLSSSMKEAEIDVSVVLPVATNPLKVSNINKISAQKTGKNGQIHFGCIHPLCENIEAELENARNLGLKGIKIHPVYQDVYIDDERFIKILTTAGKLGLTVVTHAGDDIGFPGVVRCSPEMVRRAVEKAGDVTLVLAHMGGWRNWDSVTEYLADTPVYIDTSFSLGKLTSADANNFEESEKNLLSSDVFVDIVRAFGSHRVLFGTDSPWSSQIMTVESIKALPLTEFEKQNIFENNAKRLLKLC